MRKFFLIFVTLMLQFSPSMLGLTNASVINDSFETGDFGGWQTIGAASIETASFGTAPTDGNHQLLLAPAPIVESDAWNTLSNAISYWYGPSDWVVAAAGITQTVWLDKSGYFSFDFNVLGNDPSDFIRTFVAVGPGSGNNYNT